MAPDYHVLEPFPLFVDSAGPSQPNYFSSKISKLNLLSPASSSTSTLRRRLSTSNVSNYVRLRYYQYEVTFGLYMLTSGEKAVLNTIVLGILAALSYGIFFGLQPFLVGLICRIVWYMTGTYEGLGESCT